MEITNDFVLNHEKPKVICSKEDWDCIQSVLNGDYSGFECLVDKYSGMVYSQAIKYTQNQEEAEDITQDVLLILFESLSTFRGESQFSTWLYTITKNEIIKKYKIKQTLLVEVYENPTQFEKLKKWGLSPEVQLLKQEMANTIRSLVAKLPHSYKKPLILYYFENMSYKEIAEKLNIKINTLKSNIFRGKEIIKNWLYNEH
ncbi:MAG: sigma-70 family RNA polymerase sigma factor [Leptospiraceae bacterium]|nr:sigma-70 family RNA polymerase sigma factor [Leptospiraceae bacterium]MCP5497753.1 sigma-70 family RNA polymerase sigma factor [Leptospiraceae bacterium]